MAAERGVRLGDLGITTIEGLKALNGVGGIYEFNTISGKCYVGRTINLQRRTLEHLGDTLAEGSISDIVFFSFETDNSLAMRIAEQLRMEARRGTDILENRINALNRRDRRALGIE